MWILVSFLRSELGIFEKPIGPTVNWQFPMGSANNWTNPMSTCTVSTLALQISTVKYNRCFLNFLRPEVWKWAIQLKHARITARPCFKGRWCSNYLKFFHTASLCFIHIPGSVSSMGLAFGQSHWRKISRAKVELETMCLAFRALGLCPNVLIIGASCASCWKYWRAYVSAAPFDKNVRLLHRFIVICHNLTWHKNSNI